MAAFRSLVTAASKSRSFPSSSRSSSSVFNRAQSTATATKAEAAPVKIQLPKRKKRNELSILEALASTVKQDYKAPYLEFIDDPTLIPMTGGDKEAFALAKQSGRRAARHIFAEHPEYFTDFEAVPAIPDLQPYYGYSHAEDTELGLEERISRRKVADAYQSYQRIVESGATVSEEKKLDLLDLLCSYNSEDATSEFTNMELYSIKADQVKKKWNVRSPAETLFKEFNGTSPRAYAALLKGRAKYSNAELSYALYEEMRVNKIPIDVSTFNALFMRHTPHESEDVLFSRIEDILKTMKEESVIPNELTFLNIFILLNSQNSTEPLRAFTMKVLNEMKELDIEPTLGCWRCILDISYSDRREFFPMAMRVAIVLKDLSLGYRVEELAKQQNDVIVMENIINHSTYYSRYFDLLCRFEQMPKIMEEWDRIVPHRYAPRVNGVRNLLEAIELNEGHEFLPKLWSDMMIYGNIIMRYTEVLETFVDIMASHAEPSSETQKMYMDIVDTIRKNLPTFKARDPLVRDQRDIRSCTGSIVGNLCQIYLNGDDIAEAWNIMEYYLQNRRKIEGFPQQEPLDALTKKCMETGEKDRCLLLFKVMSDLSYTNLDSLLGEFNDKFELTESDRNYLEDMKL